MLDVLGAEDAWRCHREAPVAVGGRRESHCSPALEMNGVGCSQHSHASQCCGPRKNPGGGVHGPFAAGSCWAMREWCWGMCLMCKQANVRVLDAKQVEWVDEHLHLRCTVAVPDRCG